jgi:hypothetical protein
MSLLFDKMLAARPNLSASSQSSYSSVLKQLKKHFGVESPTSADFMFDFKKLQEFINSYKNLNTRKSKIIAIIVYMSTVKDPTKKQQKIMVKLQNLLTELNDGYFSEQKTQVKSAKQEKNFITYGEYMEVLKAMKKELDEAHYKDWTAPLKRQNYYLLTNYMLARFYLDHPMRNDVANTKLITETEYKALTEEKQDDFNYLLLDSHSMPQSFKLNKFKTSKSLGRQTLDISPTLGKIIKVYLRLTGNKDFFICKEVKRGVPISPNDVSKIFNRTFAAYFPDKKISTSVIRHIMSKKFSEDNDIPTASEKSDLEKKVEQKFQHSLSTNQGIYRKK